VPQPNENYSEGNLLKMSDSNQIVYGGVDTHKHTHVAAVVDEVGRIVNTKTFQTSRGGIGDLEAWLSGHGHVAVIGVEGTGAYGLGLSRYLTESGHRVIEVNRPNRQLRRRRGKSDTVDAEAAARAALNGEADTTPKTHDGIVESIRVIRVAFTSSRDSRTRISNQMDAVIVIAPTTLRAVLEQLNADKRARTAAQFRVRGQPRTPQFPSRIRGIVRSITSGSILGENRQLPAKSRRESPSKSRTLAHSHSSVELPPTHQGLRRPAQKPRAQQTIDHSLPQTIHRPRDLPTSHQPPSSRNRRRPTTTTKRLRPQPQNRRQPTIHFTRTAISIELGKAHNLDITSRYRDWLTTQETAA